MPRYAFQPDPSKDSLSEALKCGWVYARDCVDPLLPQLKLSPNSMKHATEVVERVLDAGNVAMYCAGIGVVCGVSHDKEMEPMFLTSLQRGVRLTLNE
jgi:hypothetical protein